MLKTRISMKSGEKINTLLNASQIEEMAEIHTSDKSLALVKVEGKPYSDNSVTYYIPLDNIDYYEVIE